MVKNTEALTALFVRMKTGKIMAETILNETATTVVVEADKTSKWLSKINWLAGLIGLGSIFQMFDIPGILDAINKVLAAHIVTGKAAATLTLLASILTIFLRSNKADIK